MTHRGVLLRATCDGLNGVPRTRQKPLPSARTEHRRQRFGPLPRFRGGRAKAGSRANERWLAVARDCLGETEAGLAYGGPYRCEISSLAPA